MTLHTMRGPGLVLTTLALFLLMLPACASDVATPQLSVPALDDEHSALTAILRQVVRRDGVDYAALARLRPELDAYRTQLAQTTIPASRPAAMALWINAYNALTLTLVLDTLPAEPAASAAYSVRQVTGFWTGYRFEVAGRRVSLDDIEHRILRPMGDPRIHFAVNCASRSCPALAASAYTASRLDSQLDAATGAFANDPEQLRLVDDRLQLNPILQWFASDFDSSGGVRAFLLRHTTLVEQRTALGSPAELRFFAYDWSLNRSDSVP